MYEIIDKKLKINACNIEDLTQEMLNIFYSQFPGYSICDFIIFYNVTDKSLVLNKAHDSYEKYKLFVASYLGTCDKKRDVIKGVMPSLLMKIISIIDMAVRELYYVPILNNVI